MSRPVGGKDAARASGQGAGGRGAGAQGNGRGGKSERGGQPATGARARRAAQRQAHEQRGAKTRPVKRRPGGPSSGRGGRNRTSLYVWGSVALVVVIVAVFVAVNALSGKTTTIYKAAPVPATIVSEVTHVPPSVFDAVGTGITGLIYPPKVETGQPKLTYTGKPGVFGMFGEFCPYCAAERWSIITAFSRFGTFSGLKTMQSSPQDVYPKTQTFTFRTATYKSPYFDAKLVEYYGQDHATGNHFPITKLTKQESQLLKKYDYTATYASSGSIPFMDFGNQLVDEGVGYNPQPLQGLSRATIAAGLSNPKSSVTKLIIGDANYMSAAICHIDGGKPGSVCASSGVQAAAKALHVSA